MANVEHSALTGSNLHEPKGADTANEFEVYISDGAGSGDWTTITVDSLANTAKAFQAQLLHVVDQKSAGTDGGSFSNGAWRTRTLNTSRTNEISGASLSSNQITLPSGTYYLEARAPAKLCGTHKTRFRNVTDNTTPIVGSATIASASDFSQNESFVSGRFTIAAQKVFELQHQCQTTRNTDGFGSGSSFASEVEIFAEVKIWKVA